VDAAAPVERTWFGVLAVIGAVVTAGYFILFWSLDALPFQDLPNHLARAAAEVDLLLHGGRRFGSLFTVKLEFWPYVGGDVALSGLVAAFGPSVAGRLWVIAAAASLPVAVAVYLRWTGHSAYMTVVGILVSLYLTTDFFFVAGIHHYRLGVASVVLALAAEHSWLRGGSVRAYVAWPLFLATSYLLHLSAFLLASAGAGAIAVVYLVMRRTTWRRVAAGMLPLVALAAWHATNGSRVPAEEWVWGGLRKIPRLASPFYRYDAVLDGVLFLSYAGICTILVRGARRGLDPRFVAAAVLALIYVAGYGVMPSSIGGIHYVDARALPLAATFVLLASLAAADGREVRSAIVLGACVALAACNLAVLSTHLLRHNSVLRDYRRVAARVPGGARVLPVATGPKDGHVDAYLHAGSFATLESGALTPYLFSGGPTGFFRYRAPPRGIVDEFWYKSGTTLEPSNRAAIMKQFDYVLVKKPYDPARLPLEAEVVACSEFASLLRIVR
jgi:hypothetical protein